MYGALVWRTMRRRGAVRSGDEVAQGEGDGEGKMLRTVVEGVGIGGCHPDVKIREPVEETLSESGRVGEAVDVDLDIHARLMVFGHYLIQNALRVRVPPRGV
ncbi:hypothetical protein B0H14DRAFT_2585959 [Mycena olivaceomarginata]|nr:hypothetical protein B0H14DRAFT_2585959 [Mycena olivaceomarginata]